MLRIIYFIIFFSVLISCSSNKSETSNLCGDINCEDWQECEDSICITKDGYCEQERDCLEFEVCEIGIHQCIDNPCNSWEIYQNGGGCILAPGRCIDDSVCTAPEICSLTTHYCYLPSDPCDNIDCGGEGVCQVNLGEAECVCNSGYQDNNLDLICREGCSGAVCSVNSNGCDDSSGYIDCDCITNYFQNSSNICVTPCVGNICENGSCIAQSSSEFECICPANYFENDQFQCVTPCTDDLCTRGTCVADSMTEFHCDCPAGYHAAISECLPEVQKVVSGMFHSCAQLVDGTVVCWGNNRYNQLGDISQELGNISTNDPVEVDITDVIDISSGSNHTCVLTSNDEVYCWGDNQFCQLGREKEELLDSAVPLKIEGISGILDMQVGAHHSCVLQDNEQIKCWGGNYFGQLGDESKINSPTPVVVVFVEQDIEPPISISVGGGHNCSILADNRLFCWGHNGYGQLGINKNWGDYSGCHSASCANASEWRPEEVEDFLEYQEIFLGTTLSCAIMNDGMLNCWGDNSHGQLGNGTYDSLKKPATAPVLSGFSSVDPGGEHICGIKDGDLYCWGRDETGEVGDGDGDSFQDQLEPILIQFDSQITQVDTGISHTCAINSGGVFCWGNNTQKQLGVDLDEQGEVIEQSSEPINAAGFIY